MALGKLLNRSTTQIDITNLDSGASQTFTITGLTPSWSGSTYASFLSIPAAGRAFQIIADTLAPLPFDALRGTEVLASTFLDRPNPNETRVNTMTTLLLDLVFAGNAFALIAARDSQGFPTAILPLPAGQVSVRQNSVNGRIEYSAYSSVYAADDVLHIHGPKLASELRAYSPIELHWKAGDLAKGLVDEARSVSNHGVPTGLLKATGTDVTKDVATAAKTAWLQSQSSRTIAFLSPGVDFVPLSWTPTDSQLIEARQFDLKTWALIFGLPFSMLGADNGGSMTYSNTEVEASNLIRYSSIRGHLARIEAALSDCFPRGTVVKANVDALLRGVTTERYAAYSTALAAGFLTVDEVRALEDLPAISTPAQENPV